MRSTLNDRASVAMMAAAFVAAAFFGIRTIQAQCASVSHSCGGIAGTVPCTEYPIGQCNFHYAWGCDSDGDGQGVEFKMTSYPPYWSYCYTVSGSVTCTQQWQGCGTAINYSAYNCGTQSVCTVPWRPVYCEADDGCI
jgi:hypothetical protein